MSNRVDVESSIKNAAGDIVAKLTTTYEVFPDRGRRIVGQVIEAPNGWSMKLGESAEEPTEY
jgi:hypothetical protein